MLNFSADSENVPRPAGFLDHRLIFSDQKFKFAKNRRFSLSAKASKDISLSNIGSVFRRNSIYLSVLHGTES